LTRHRPGPAAGSAGEIAPRTASSAAAPVGARRSALPTTNLPRRSGIGAPLRGALEIRPPSSSWPDRVSAIMVTGAMTSKTIADGRPSARRLRTCRSGSRGPAFSSVTCAAQKFNRGAELCVAPGCAHNVHLEKPALFNRVVGDFLLAAAP
jgi:pimeloyl-ACP methyl ester carboxylesterase